MRVQSARASKAANLKKSTPAMRESLGVRDKKSTPATTPPTLPVRDEWEGVASARDARVVPLGQLVPDPAQPRKHFDEEGLTRLAESLRRRGQLQPIRVRWDGRRRKYLVLCGERRLRAAQLAKLPSLTAIVHEGDLSDDDKLVIQLLENTGREDLGAIEKCDAMVALRKRGMSERDIAGETGLSQTQVHRLVSLWYLPRRVRRWIRDGRLPESTAYELVKLPRGAQQVEMAREAMREKLSRGQVAARIRARFTVNQAAPPAQMNPLEIQAPAHPSTVLHTDETPPGRPINPAQCEGPPPAPSAREIEAAAEHLRDAIVAATPPPRPADDPRDLPGQTRMEWADVRPSPAAAASRPAPRPADPSDDAMEDVGVPPADHDARELVFLVRTRDGLGVASVTVELPEGARPSDAVAVLSRAIAQAADRYGVGVGIGDRVRLPSGRVGVVLPERGDDFGRVWVALEDASGAPCAATVPVGDLVVVERARPAPPTPTPPAESPADEPAGSLLVRCPHCGAGPGRACFGSRGPTPTHARRHDAAERHNGKLARQALRQKKGGSR